MEKRHTMATHKHIVGGRRSSAQFIAGALRIFSWIHITVYRWTGGIIGGRIFGNRILLLTTTGRKTGQPRTKPVGYLTDGDAMIIVGGAAATAKHPDWFRNVQAVDGCMIRWKGVNYQVIEPVVVDWATVRAAFYPIERVVVPLIGIEQFVRLKHAPASSNVS